MSQENPSCPKCGSNMFDNRESKQNPKAPDFKCKDRNCDGVIWPPRKTAPKKAPEAPKGYNAGPLLPNEEPGYLEALAGHGGGAGSVSIEVESQKDKVERMYLESMNFVINKVVPVWTAGEIAYDAGHINASTATMLIQRNGR